MKTAVSPLSACWPAVFLQHHLHLPLSLAARKDTVSTTLPRQNELLLDKWLKMWFRVCQEAKNDKQSGVWRITFVYSHSSWPYTDLGHQRWPHTAILAVTHEGWAVVTMSLIMDQIRGLMSESDTGLHMEAVSHVTTDSVKNLMVLSHNITHCDCCHQLQLLCVAISAPKHYFNIAKEVKCWAMAAFSF